MATVIIADLTFPGARVDPATLGFAEALQLGWMMLGVVSELDEAAVALHVFRYADPIGAGMPPAYARQVQFVGAKAFVNALDMVANLLDALSQETGAPAGIAAARAQLLSGIPDLGELRDSIAHHDERMRSRAHKKVVQPKPNANDLALCSLDGDALSTMSRTGHQARVPINEATLFTARDAVQAAIDALPWEPSPWPHKWPVR